MKNFLGMAAVFFISLSLSGCGSSILGGITGTSITVSGNLASSSLESNLLGGSALAGATALCATLTSTPVSGTGVSDSSGNFSVTLNSVGQPFGCFLTPSGASTSVPLLFSSGSSNSTMATASTNVSLGAVAVTTNGNGSIVAQATLPATAALQTTTPAGLSCLAGRWKGTMVGTTQTCNGAQTSYELFFTPLPDGSFANSYVETDGVTNTLHLTGATTSGSNCISVSSTTSLAVGMTVTDMESWTTNPGGAAIIPTPSTITSLTACGASQVQLSNPASATVASDSFLVTVCGTTAHNTKNVTYSAANSTVAMTYPQACYDVGISHLNGGFWDTVTGTAGFTADLTAGSQCISNIGLPTGNQGTTVILATYQAMDNAGGLYFPATTIAAVPGTCPAGTFQMSVSSLATGTAELEVYNLPAGTGFTTFNFYASMTMGSPCVTPVLPTGLAGYYVGDSAGAISAAAGSGVTLVAASGSCTGLYMLSEAAGANSTSGESLVILPTGQGKKCPLGLCFDTNGNAYAGGATCPTGAAALIAQTEIDTLPITSDCTRIWTSEANSCVSAIDTSLGSLQAHCGGSTLITSTDSVPASAVRHRYAQTNTGCAACFPSILGAPTDYPANGCVGYGHASCTSTSNGVNDVNTIVIKQ